MVLCFTKKKEVVLENGEVRLIKETEYLKLHEDSNQTIGITHHREGLGKLKVSEGGTEFGVPITDIINKPLSDWRIDKK